MVGVRDKFFREPLLVRNQCRGRFKGIPQAISHHGNAGVLGFAARSASIRSRRSIEPVRSRRHVQSSFDVDDVHPRLQRNPRIADSRPLLQPKRAGASGTRATGRGLSRRERNAGVRAQDSLAQAAICLKEVLDRVELPPEDEIPGLDDLKDENGEALERWHVPGTQIVIGRVAAGPQMHEYVFTPSTVRRAVELYEDMAGLPYRDDGPKVSPGLYLWYMSAPADPTIGALVARFPDWTQNRFLDLAVWQWLAVTLGLVVAMLLFSLIYRLQRTRAELFRETSLLRYFLTLWWPLAAVFIPIGFRHFTRHYLGVHGDPYLVISFAANLMSLLALIVVIFAVGNRITEAILSPTRISPQGLDAQLIRIVGKLTALIVSIVVFLQGGSYLGIPLTTLLTSAGVGGLAVALAAQDTIKNVFGTIVLMSDKPFRVGERIVIKDYDGVVESIGLRSTRIRLLTGHQVTVPNDELARSDIENVGRRPYIRRRANLQFPLDTPREKIEAAVEQIRKALANHEGMEPALPPRVFFNEFNSESFNVIVIYWYHPQTTGSIWHSPKW